MLLVHTEIHYVPIGDGWREVLVRNVIHYVLVLVGNVIHYVPVLVRNVIHYVPVLLPNHHL